jgi:large subunit ribosomal protein L22
MKAHLHSVRIAPKKANLIARIVRGLTVPDAVEALRTTNKKGARIIEKLLLSAMANASHNDKQDPQMMVIKEIVVNQGQAYRRGMPKARGQVRPYRKFLSHITVTLGYAEDLAKSEESASQKAAKPVQPSRKGTVTSKAKNDSASAKSKTSKKSSSSRS